MIQGVNHVCFVKFNVAMRLMQIDFPFSKLIDDTLN